MPDRDRPLVLVSNRGPVTYPGRRFDQARHRRARDGADRPGLAPRRVWIASAMTDDDAQRAARARRRAVRDRRAARRRVPRALRGVRSRRPTTASTTSSPTRCSGSSSTTCGTRATRRTSAATRSRRSSTATTSSTRTWRAAVLQEIEDDEEPVVMVHDYHFYTLPGMIRRAAPGRLPAPLHPHPVDAVGRLARAARRTSATRSSAGCWRTTSSASTRAPTGATSCSAAAI